MPGLKDFIAKIGSSTGGRILEGAKGIIKQFNLSPEQEKEFELKMTQEINRAKEAESAAILKELELENADRQSARTREAEFVKATGRADVFQHVIGYAAIAMTAGIIIFIMFRDIPDKNEHILLLVVGEILGITSAIYSYHFGSSAGSRFKDMRK